MKISVIVPVLNEEKSLPAFLRYASKWEHVDEILFVDGGSTDSTCDLLLQRGHFAITGAHGRGAQCRLGVEEARGDAFVFIHADSLVPPDSMEAIRTALEKGTPWGCLTLRFRSYDYGMKIGAWASNARVRFTGIPFGDQVMFVTRDAYERVGGMPDIPIMEDYELSRQLRSISWPKQLRQKVYTSARRFEEGGALRTMAQMRHLRHLYRKGVDASEIAQLYQSGKLR